MSDKAFYVRRKNEMYQGTLDNNAAGEASDKSEVKINFLTVLK